VALALLSGAGLFARSLIAAMELNSGLDTTHLIVGNISLAQYLGRYDATRAGTFFDDLSTRLAANPAIRAMAYSVRQGGMSAIGTLNVNGVPRAFPSFVGFTMVNPDYFRMIGIPLLQGRDFSRDDREKGNPVVIVSESFGRMLANGGNPLGSRITMPFRRPDSPATVAEVVGVVGDVISNISILEPLDMYFPIAQMGPILGRELVVRPAGDLEVARREIVSAIKQIDPVVTPPLFQTMEERISRQMGPQKFGASLMGALGGIAVVLTLLGTYVLAESMTVLRLREMGIRAALGATGRQLASLVFEQTIRFVVAGIGAGTLIVVAGANTIRAFLFQIRPRDPLTLAITAGLILGLALLVSLRPALRAARIDIIQVLREE
jgi:putative ABC transport system permease protein